ncbi:MAG: HNH endonuclease signature motif containing protein [Planctomycetota bacterium]
MTMPPQKKMTITFDDLPLQLAIRELFSDPSFVRSEALLITDAGREWILQKIIANLSREFVGHYRFERILLSVNQFRKLDKGALSKRLIVLEHADKQKSHNCFYEGKLNSACSTEIDLDRIKPGKRGGEYTAENTVLSCSYHNRSRGCKEVEAFWKQ